MDYKKYSEEIELVSVFCQRYFRYTKSLTEKIRKEIALELVEGAIGKNAIALRDKTTIDGLQKMFEKELKGKSASDLLKVDKQAFVKEWIDENTKSFTETIRKEVALELAKEAFSKDGTGYIRGLQDMFKKELKDKSVSDLLKIEKDKYVSEWRSALVNQNKALVKSAISSLDARYSSEIGKSVAKDKAFANNFTLSEAFKQWRGMNHIMTHQEMENALLMYFDRESNLLEKNAYAAIEDKQKQEKTAIDGLKKEYLKCKMSIQRSGTTEELLVHVPPETTESIIDIWQKQQGYQKNVSEEENKQAVKDFISKAHEATKKAVLKVFSKNPRRETESASSYKNRLSPLIEENIEGNEVARCLYMHYLQPIIDREGSDDTKKISEMLGKITQNEGEFVDDYIRRARQEIKDQIAPDIYKDVAVDTLMRLTAKKRAEYAVKFIFQDEEFKKTNPNFTKFTEKEKKEFNSKLQSFLEPRLPGIEQEINKDDVRGWAGTTIKMMQEENEQKTINQNSQFPAQ